MKQFRKRLRNKLKSQKGETLSEVLIAVLVSSLGLTLLAAMITSSGSIINKSKKNFNNYVKGENQLVEQPGTGDKGYLNVSGTVLSDDSRLGDGSRFEVEYFTNIIEDATNKTIYTYKAK